MNHRITVAALALGTAVTVGGVGLAVASNDAPMAAPLLHARHVHQQAVAARAHAKAAAKAEAWAHDMHNPTVLEQSVKDSYSADLVTLDDPSASIDDVTCLLISKANRNLFSCLISASATGTDDVTATHEVLVSEDGKTWVAKS